MVNESNCLTHDVLIGLLQDSLSKEDQLSAAEHVQTCENCQKELETICEQRKIEIPESTLVEGEKSQGAVVEWSGKLAERLMVELQQHGPTAPHPESAAPPSLATIITVEELAESEQTVHRGAVDSETSVTQQHSSCSTSPTELHIAEMFGRYKVEKILGQGAMGAVYLARDTQLDRDVALKIPKFGSGNNVDGQELLERFYREARAAATLRSPYICSVHDVGEIDGQHYITMAYIEGRPLKDFTKSKKKHSEKQIATTVRKLAQGLSEAHEIGVVHRDLKPANVMVDKKGEPVVMDFGLARRSSSDDVQVTQSGAIMGTPAYMSPEQVEGDQEKIGPQADIYALGIIMYELITGDMPYKGSLMSILQQIALNNPEKPSKLRSDLDPRLEKICLKMMAGDLAKRYQSMEEVAADLQEVMRTPRKKNKQQTSANPSPKQTWIPTATEESNPALISIAPQSITEQLREKRGASKSKRQTSSGSSSSGGNKNVLIAGGVIGLLLLMGIVFLVRVGKYDVQITLDDPSITLSVDDNKLNIKDGKNVIQLSAGPHKLQLEKDGLKTQVEEFTVTEDGKTALTAKVVNGKLDAIWEGESRLGTNKHKDEQTHQAATTPLTPETVNHALSFDGSDDYVVVDGLFLDDSDEWTIELQVSVSERSKEHERSAILAGTGQHFLALQIRYDYNHLTPFHITNGTQMEQENQAYWEPQKPYDVAIVIKGSDYFLFVDGDEKMRSTGKRVRRSFDPPKHDFLLGAGRDWHGERSLWQHFGGVIDEVRISKIARYTEAYFPEARLKSDEYTIALYHFDEGQGDSLMDASGNGNHGKIVGAKWVRVDDSLKVIKQELKSESPAPFKNDDPLVPANAPFNSEEASKFQERWAKHLDVPVEYTNSVGMKFRLIPPGEFMMGCPDDEIEWAMSQDSMADSHEPKIRSAGPQHQVALTRPYYMSTTEVTQSVYKQVMGKNPSQYSEGNTESEDGKKIVGIDTSQFPAESMTWLDAAEFCAKLSEMEQLKPQYFRGGLITLLEGNGYRLPTEAEWEFACRAGTTTMNWAGDEQEVLRASDWTGLNSGGRPHNVGQLKPNPFGLFDMLGNVWEWTGDHYEEGYFETLSGQLTVDPEGPTNDDHLRIIKGGQIHDYANARSGARSIYSRGFSREHLGFRLVLPVEAVKELLGK